MQVIDCLKSTKRSKFVKILFLSTLILLVHLFLGFAVSHSLNDCIAVFGKWIVDHAVPHLKFVTLLIQPIPNCTWRGVNLFASSFISLLLGAFFSWVFVDSWKEPTRVRVRSFFGAFVFLLIVF
uniref:Transmembrane protein n=1 Tax=Ditylenchus dipsaci TaxID=166011 RepID=A0A915EAG3_9BILA